MKTLITFAVADKGAGHAGKLWHFYWIILAGQWNG